MKSKAFMVNYPLALLVIFTLLFTLQTSVWATDISGPADKAELEKFMDDTITQAMQKYHLPGTVFCIVKDGKVFLEKGYGYSNIEKKSPVDPQNTVFRVGSISKLFTATAVMQLKEQGKIDLRRDVNEYLKGLKVKNRYAKPVTMYHLLTHTAGFDDRWTGVEVPDYSKVSTLEDYLSKNVPEIIREPGTVTQYSNHGMTLAGLIVEEVSGMPYEEYIMKNIVSPLGMNQTYPRIAQGITGNLALEYTFKNGSYKPMQLYEFNIFPVSSVCSTASDMAKFMIAHLNNGALGGNRILKQETAQEMHSTQFAYNSELPGMCYGFCELVDYNHRFITHGGDTNGTHSLLLLDPTLNIGLFVSTNGVQGQSLITELGEKFIKRYYSTGKTVTIAEPNGNVQYYGINPDGNYRSVRYARNTLDKLVLLLTPQVNIKVRENSIVLEPPYGEGRYVQVGPLLFRNQQNGKYLSFKTGNRGDVVYMFSDNPTFAFERVRWYESNNLHIIIIGATVLLSLAWCICHGITSFRARKKKNRMQGGFSGALLTFISIINVGSLIGIFVTLLSMDSVLDIGFQLPLAMKILLSVQVAAAVLTVILAAIIFTAWRKGFWKIPGRVFFSLVGVLNICFTVVMYYYNLIGIRY